MVSAVFTLPFPISNAVRPCFFMGKEVKEVLEEGREWSEELEGDTLCMCRRKGSIEMKGG